MLWQTLEKRTPLMNEKQLIASIKKYVSLRTFPLWDGETLLGAVSIFKDVTRLHQLNQEMRRISGIMDEYSRRIRSLETAEKLEITSYNLSLIHIYTGIIARSAKKATGNGVCLRDGFAVV